MFGPCLLAKEEQKNAWCIATIMRLVGSFGPPVDTAYSEEFALAEKLTTMLSPNGFMMVISWPPWREALEAIPDPPVPTDLLDFIQMLLVIDPDRRPTASEALMHPYLCKAFDATIVKWQPQVYDPGKGDLVFEWKEGECSLREPNLEEQAA